MAKKWHGIEELIDKEIDMPKDLWQYEETMRGIPNFDKSKEVKKRKINKKFKYKK